MLTSKYLARIGKAPDLRFQDILLSEAKAVIDPQWSEREARETVYRFNTRTHTHNIYIYIYIYIYSTVLILTEHKGYTMLSDS